jgi:hypothetical protein
MPSLPSLIDYTFLNPNKRPGMNPNAAAKGKPVASIVLLN